MLTAPQMEAAALVARGRLTHKKIGEKVGVSERTIDTWNTLPEFKQFVEELLNGWMHEIHTKGIGDRKRRLFRLNDRWRRLQALIEARANDPEIRRLRGGSTGLIVRKLRSLRAGDGHFDVIEEAVYDSAVFRDLLAIEQQAARELGQWDTQDERKIRRLSDLSQEEVQALMADIQKTFGLTVPAELAPGAGGEVVQ